MVLAIGAIAGSLLRWQIDNNLLVNALGCLVLGMIFSLRYRKDSYLLIGIGFCGGLTTFSGVISDSLGLISNQEIINAIKLITISLITGLISMALGFVIGLFIRSPKRFQLLLLDLYHQVRQRF